LAAIGRQAQIDLLDATVVDTALRHIRRAGDLFRELGMFGNLGETEIGRAELLIYFGGPLDDAIEACRRAADAKQRVSEGGALRAIFVEGYCRMNERRLRGCGRSLRHTPQRWSE
jgi:hypothetical protein